MLARVEFSQMNEPMYKQAVIDGTRQWIARMVIGLNLCPFAQRVFDGGRIRFVVSDTADEATLLKELADELEFLAAAPIATIETTLLIHPLAFPNFLDYNDFLGVAEHAVADLGYEGVIQIASFHPDYQFADTDADDPANYTNRSPYPMLHLLREESISAVAEDEEKLLEIPQRNIDVLRALGRENILERLKSG
jgi:uncharacterized protein